MKKTLIKVLQFLCQLLLVAVIMLTPIVLVNIIVEVLAHILTIEVILYMLVTFIIILLFYIKSLDNRQ